MIGAMPFERRDAPGDGEDFEPFRGWVMGALADEEGWNIGIRIPRNGLWWDWETDSRFGGHNPNGFEDCWILVPTGPLYPSDLPDRRPKLGTWVEVVVHPKTRCFTLHTLPPRRVRMVGQVVPRDANTAERFDAPTPCERPSFPDDPDLEAWAVAIFNSQLDGTWRYAVAARGFTCGWRCICGYLECGSVTLRVEESPEPGWLLLSDWGTMQSEVWTLGPVLEVADPYAVAAEG